MFGILKKKLKDSIKKLSRKAKEEDVATKEMEIIDKELEHISDSQKMGDLEHEDPDTTDELPEEDQESLKEPLAEPQITEPEDKIAEELHIKTKPKRSLKKKFIKSISVKTLSERDVEDFFSDFETDLLESSVALEVVDFLKKDLKQKLVGKDLKRGKVDEEITKVFETSITNILKQEHIDIEEVIKNARKQGRPALFLFLGFNGVGKTTSLAKVGYLLKEKGYKVIFAAADTYRAASEEQLQVHADKLGIKMIKHQHGADPAAVIFDAMKHGAAKNIDCVLADTAGRSHSNINLSDELKKIVRVNKPDLNILVLEGISGNDIIPQCQKFDESAGVHGMILTKLDVDEKGGSLLSASYVTKKPILYIGSGQKYHEFKVYNYKEISKQFLS